MPAPIQVNARVASAGNQLFTINALPDECPRCHKGGLPVLLGGCAPDTGPPGQACQVTGIEVFFQCSRHGCGAAFIGRYTNPGPLDQSNHSTVFAFSEAVPLNAHDVVVDRIISEVSPAFIEIMSQVAVAESHQLSQLVGIGLRKGLEFLIKDFTTLQNKDDEAKVSAIETTALGSVITTYVDHPKLKSVARRASWLGNDETHYVRRWEDKDIKDLRALIQLTTAWIVQVVLSERYEIEMPEKS